MSVYKRGDVWWYRFVWQGREIRNSTKRSNKRIAEQIEAAYRTSLAKGEVGIWAKTKAPTLKAFAEGEFLKHIEAEHRAKRSTLSYYRLGLKSILEFPGMAKSRLDEIRREDVAAFVAYLRTKDFEVSTMNRKLEVLRRMFKLAQEWERVEKALPKVTLLSGEKRRARVLTLEEEAGYLKA